MTTGAMQKRVDRSQIEQAEPFGALDGAIETASIERRSKVEQGAWNRRERNPIAGGSILVVQAREVEA